MFVIVDPTSAHSFAELRISNRSWPEPKCYGQAALALVQFSILEWRVGQAPAYTPLTRSRQLALARMVGSFALLGKLPLGGMASASWRALCLAIGALQTSESAPKYIQNSLTQRNSACVLRHWTP